MSRLGTCHRADVPSQAPADNGAVTSLWAPSGRDRPIRLLVVDDDARVRAAIAETVTGEADMVVVAECADAATAVVLAGRTNPSVALADVLVPDLEIGLDLIATLARTPGCSVVAMSVRGGLRPAVLAAGAVAFVEKSGDIEAILATVRAAALPHNR